MMVARRAIISRFFSDFDKVLVDQLADGVVDFEVDVGQVEVLVQPGFDALVEFLHRVIVLLLAVEDVVGEKQLLGLFGLGSVNKAGQGAQVISQVLVVQARRKGLHVFRLAGEKAEDAFEVAPS